MNSPRSLSLIDKFIIESDRVLRTLNRSTQTAAQTSPASPVEELELSTQERKHAAGLMRINHTGEVCAQALYQGQALTAKLPDVRDEMESAAAEEVDHLVWCDERIKQLNSYTSRLNPLFYSLSFSMGAFAGAVSDKVSLGFVAATEELVCKHLEKHLHELPKADEKSRAIVSQMLADEARHQQTALDAGGAEFPAPIKFAMSLLSKAMTKTTYHI
ncbi:MAG: 2-polyprenyl-3-methyl-6-methoxy-1,4-benzoquinone monooxygenase [Cellvibrionaceae bacterium]